MLQIINVSDFGLVNDIFYIAPQKKIQWCNIRETWWPWNGTIMSNPPIWKCFIQKLMKFKNPIRWCNILLENNLLLILFKLCFSAKKNRPITLSCMIPHHTFSLGESYLSSQVSCRFSEPHIPKLCLFSIQKRGILTHH